MECTKFLKIIQARYADLSAALADPEPDTLAVLGVFGEVRIIFFCF